MIKIGAHYSLKVSKSSPQGYYVDADNYGSLLLPKKHAPKNLARGDSVKVFLYLDSDDRPIATCQSPKAEVGQFAYLKVIDTNTIGAFLDWGLDKDLLVPFGEQHRPMILGNYYLVYIYVDKVDSRITASSKIDKFLDYDKAHNFKAQESVDLIIANSTDLGYKAIVNHSHWGMLYKNEVKQLISFGDSLQGVIKNIRKDGRIDLSLQSAQTERDLDEQKILMHLKQHAGKSTFHDKSDPKEISKTFQMSKGAFKKALGRLYKQKIIALNDKGFQLLK